jgi:predicted kinase
MKDLILLRGLPGAGKSTFAKMLGGNYYEADDYFYDDEGNYNFNQRDLPKAHNWCKFRVEEAMNFLKEERIVVANTFTQEWEMKEYFELAEKYGYRVFTLIVENRHGSKSVHDVPDATIGNMLHRFQIKL